jgi:predicted permease
MWTTLFDAIFPLFAIALIGYLAAWRGLFAPAAVDGLSRYVYYVAVPALLFYSLATLELPAQINWAFLLAYYLAAFTIYAVGMAISRWGFRHSLREQGVFGMGGSYSNTVIVGLPVVLGALGESALLPLLLIIALHSGLMSLAVATVAEADPGPGRAAAHSRRRMTVLAAVARRVATNPITLGLAAGLVVNWLGLSLPAPVAKVTDVLGQSVLPCALFVLGATLRQYRLARYSTEAWTLVGLKLVAHPLLAWLTAWYVFRLSGVWAAVAVVTAGLPIGVNVSVFANRYEACVPTVAAATLLSTVLAVVSLSGILVLIG